MTHQADRVESTNGTTAVVPDRTQRYARSIDLYRRAQDSLAGGVSSNFRLGGDPVPLVLRPGGWRSPHRCRRQRLRGLRAGHGPVDPGSRAGVRGGRGPRPARRGASCSPGQTTDEVELAERFQAAVPVCRAGPVRQLGHRDGPGGAPTGAGATGRPIIVKFEGHYHGWLDPILVSTAATAGQGRPCGRTDAVAAERRPGRLVRGPGARPALERPRRVGACPDRARP